MELALGTVVPVSGVALGRLQYVQYFGRTTVERALGTVVLSGMAFGRLQYVQYLGRTTVERALGTVVLSGVALGRLQYLPAFVAQVLKHAAASELSS